MISHDYKLIFIHIPKCAGRSVSEIFNQRFDQFTAAHYEREYPRFWKEYSRFAIVRNPYARLVSMYHYIQQHRRHRYEKIAIKGAPFQPWVILNLEEAENFFDLNSPEAQRGTDGDLGSPHWFSPQCWFLKLQQPERIEIFKLEDGMIRVEEYLEGKGVKGARARRMNPSSHGPWEEYITVGLAKYLRRKAFITMDCEKYGYEIL